MTKATGITSVEIFLAHVRTMASESGERYDEMAEQMELHNNERAARCFRDLNALEKAGLKRIETHIAGRELPKMAPWDFAWGEAEAPCTLSVFEVHYMMRPHHVLSAALKAKKCGLGFIRDIENSTTDEEIRAMARTIADGVGNDVKTIEKWLLKATEPGENWDEDPDPPTLPE